MLLICIASFSIGALEYLSNKRVVTQSLKKRNESFGLLLMLLSLIILMGGSSQNPDTQIYKNIYATRFYSKDPGFGIIISFLKSRGVSLDIIRLGIAIIGLALINNVVKRYLSPRYQFLFYLLYLIYPFFMDVTQVRNFWSAAILTYAFDYLLSENNRGIIIYLFLITLAASIQKAFIIYIPFAFIKRVNKEQAIRYLLGGAAVFSVLILWNKSLVVVLSNVLNEWFADNITDLSHYLAKSTRFGGYVYWLQTFLNLFILRQCLRIQRKCCVPADNRKYRFSELVYWANVYSIIFLPLVLITIDFFRIQRNLTLLNYIVILITFAEIRRSQLRTRTRQNLVLLVVILIAYAFYWMFLHDGDINTIIIPILNNNWLIP